LREGHDWVEGRTFPRKKYFWRKKLVFFSPPLFSRSTKADKSRIFFLTKQGDQIGRLFAYWVVVYLGPYFLNYRSRPHFWESPFHDKS
jgi:hypothetical protein